MELLPFLCAIFALAMLVKLAWIDWHEKILPNEYVLLFFCSALTFHLASGFTFLNMKDMAAGLMIGSGTLYIIRLVASRFYGQDALGLGDVKLMGAAGAWLGPQYILPAMIIGALCGLGHGLALALHGYRSTKTWPSLQTLPVPAGPGFTLGIALTAAFMFASQMGAWK